MTQEQFFAKYQADPIGFQVDCLDVNPDYVWDKMREVAESVRDNKKTCVYAGHSVSKSFEAARLALWFLFTHKPSTVISTAPTFDQVEKILWKEIHTSYANAKIPLGGKLTTTQLDIDPARKWFAYGIATKADTVTGEATRIQGAHNTYVLVILDEAAGILPQIWKAIEHLLTDPNCYVLAIGNPTSAQGSFADCENDPTWHCITISVTDTPNFKEGQTIIPGVSGREYEEEIRRKYGIESNEYGIRILGRKPEFSQGTYLGKWMAEADKTGRIGSIVHEASAPVYTVGDYGDVYSAIWFFQLIKEQIRLIDFYYDCEGKGMPAYSLLFQGKPYKYGGHFAPHDLWGSNAKKQGVFTIEVAHSLGIDFEEVPLVNVDDRIEAARGILPKCWFTPECSDGVTALQNWRKRKNEALSTPDKPVYFEEAVRDWTCHVGDAFSYFAVAYRYMQIGGRVMGSLEPEIPIIGNHSAYSNNILGREIRCRKVG